MRLGATRTWGLALAAAAMVGLAGIGPIGPAGSSGGPAPSIDGLTRQPADALRCPNLFEISLPAGGYVCTHGPDPAPPGVDYRVARPLRQVGPDGLLLPDSHAGTTKTSAAGAPSLSCYGNGEDGNRVQAVYAYLDGRPDRFDQVAPNIVQWAAETDAVFARSAQATGGVRHVRWVHDAACRLTIMKVKLSRLGAKTFAQTEAEIAALGLTRADRKYLVWMDATEICGEAGYYIDDSPGQSNANNGNPSIPGLVARVDAGCWGFGSEGESVEAHELMHSLGSVMPTAPNATEYGHCRDTNERMCYADGTLLSLLLKCGSDHGSYFDCNNDDYFHTNPPKGNYLQTHWNTASSSFLSSVFRSPQLVVNDVGLAEGNSGVGQFAFTLGLSAPTDTTVSVRYATSDGSARAGEDYTAVAGTASFAPGETTKVVNVPVSGDVRPEPSETFNLNLSLPSGVSLPRSQAIGTILDDDPKGQSYWMVASDGGIFTFADARYYGSTGGIKLNQPIVGMAVRNDGKGYWLVAKDGGIFAFGDAPFYGSTGNIRLAQPIVGMTAAKDASGYWFVASDGGIFNYGGAKFFGSAAPARQPVVGMAATGSGQGYWLAGRDGDIYAFGDAAAFPSLSGLNQPIVGMAATPSGKGLWLVARDGGIFAFGDAGFFGSTGGIKLNQPIVGIAPSPSGKGYWMVASDGGIFAFGDAGFWGSTGDIKLNQPIVGIGTSGAAG